MPHDDKAPKKPHPKPENGHNQDVGTSSLTDDQHTRKPPSPTPTPEPTPTPTPTPGE